MFDLLDGFPKSQHALKHPVQGLHSNGAEMGAQALAVSQAPLSINVPLSNPISAYISLVPLAFTKIAHSGLCSTVDCRYAGRGYPIGVPQRAKTNIPH